MMRLGIIQKEQWNPKIASTLHMWKYITHIASLLLYVVYPTITMYTSTLLLNMCREGIQETTNGG